METHEGKCIIFLIAYGEMHDLLAWKRLASLIKFLRMDFMNLLHYLQNIKMFILTYVIWEVNTKSFRKEMS